MVAQFGQLAGVALTRQNRIENAQTAHSTHSLQFPGILPTD
jgi:hypothetical protein